MTIETYRNPLRNCLAPGQRTDMRFLLRRIIYLSLLLGILVVPLVLLNSEWREAAMRGGSDILGKLVNLPGQLLPLQSIQCQGTTAGQNPIQGNSHDLRCTGYQSYLNENL